jgi:adenylyltransferase/sulfurtransferase
VLFRATDNGRSKADVAAERAMELNPDVRVTALDGNIMLDVGLGRFADADVVIGCLDNREARLWVNRCGWKVNRPWVDGGIQEISGVVKVFVPPDSACYECGMSEMDYKLINLKYSCPLLKREDILQGKVPTAPTISSIIAGIQTQEALKILHKMEVRAGTAMVFSGETNNFYTTSYQKKPDCLSHDHYPEVVGLPLSARTATVEQLFAAAARCVGTEDVILHLDRDLLVSLVCPTCDVRRDVLAPVMRVSLEQGRCAGCGEVSQTDIVYDIALEERFRGKTLHELGVPDFDIVKVTGSSSVGFFRLDGDRERALTQGPIEPDRTGRDASGEVANKR